MTTEVMQKVLVTGAAGFLGAWIVESFQLAGLPVRAGVRQWNSAVRLARRDTEIVPCDVMSPNQLRAALEGCDAVVHCATGPRAVIVNGTQNVLAAAQEMKLRRTVHLSSVAVYGNATGAVDEQHARRGQGNSYASNKIDAEHICEQFIAGGAPVVILRPSIIYGPFSYAWTVSFANRLWSGQWGTFGRAGEGKCNLVYVTDVVQAIFRALQSENAVGETFNVNGPEIITWNDYFVRFNKALGRQPLRALKTWPIAVKSRLLSPVRAVGRLALTRFNSTLMKLHTKSPLAAKYMKVTESSLKLTPTSDQLKLYGLDVEYLIDKARARLEYAPQVGANQGIEFGAAWLRQQELLF
jgi:nucleoside-diphosphate-sugar epimerase